MLDELSTLLNTFTPESSRSDYLAAIMKHNVLGKQMAATRKLTAQRLTELYALN